MYVLCMLIVVKFMYRNRVYDVKFMYHSVLVLYVWCNDSNLSLLIVLDYCLHVLKYVD